MPATVTVSRTNRPLRTRTTAIFASVRAGIARVSYVVRRIVGVPDYESYVRHMRKHHREREPLSQREFVQQCWADKYSRPGHRCC
jgi:uncharacterized short protein YbdD (DUF466 family)